MAELVFKVKLYRDRLSGGEIHFFESPAMVQRSLESFLFQGRPFVTDISVTGDPLERNFDYRVLVETKPGSQFSWEDFYNLLARFFSSRALIF